MANHNQMPVVGLPENAYKELKEGEEYIPILPADRNLSEMNAYTITLGLLMAIVFSAAAAYLGLKIGQVFEAAIPIAIIAVGVSTLLKKQDALSQNVIIQSIGASSGLVVAGGIFTLPALYILNLQVEFYQIFFSSLFGGILGILFLVPFRKYFVSDMHGKLPFPEATATNEILISGEKGGSQALLLLVSGLIGGIYDFIIGTFGLWSEVFTTRVISFGEMLSDKAKIVFKLNVGAAVTGLGYIVGLKYSAIICAGSFLGWYLLIPVISHFSSGQTIPVGTNVTKLIGQMTPEEIFRGYVRLIGIGGIAMAGIIGIIRSSKIIKSAVTLAGKEIFSKQKSSGTVLRTQRDLPMGIIAGGILLTAIILLVFFYFGVVHNIGQSLIALAIIMVIAFLFTTVAANAIAIVGTNPVSGMTLMTLIITSLVMVSVGLSGPSGMVAALVIGGVVCTALSMAGGLITDLKIGYWVGTTPYKQQISKLMGTVVAAATVGLTIMVLSKEPGFTGPNAFAAPQANAMAAVIGPMMSGQPAPWFLYAGGAFMSLILTMIGIPALAFSLGMFIPLELNTPLLIGGLIAHYVGTRSKDEKLNNARKSRGTLIASGFIAGGALMGLISVILKAIPIDLTIHGWAETNGSEILGLVMFIVLCIYMIWDSMRAKAED